MLLLLLFFRLRAVFVFVILTYYIFACYPLNGYRCYDLYFYIFIKNILSSLDTRCLKQCRIWNSAEYENQKFSEHFIFVSTFIIRFQIMHKESLIMYWHVSNAGHSFLSDLKCNILLTINSPIDETGSTTLLSIRNGDIRKIVKWKIFQNSFKKIGEFHDEFGWFVRENAR